MAVTSADALVETLRRELDARAAGEAGLRSRLVEAESRLAARVLLDQRTTVLLGALRAELEELRRSLEHERSRRVTAEHRAGDLQRHVTELRAHAHAVEREAAEREAQAIRLEDRVAELERELSGERERSLDARDAIGDLRDALEHLRLPEAVGSEAEPGPVDPVRSVDPVGPVDPAGPVEPARLNEALARLRETIVPEEPGPAEPRDSVTIRPPQGPRRSVRATFTRLVGEDADAAGRFALELLVLQHVAYPHPVSYDLVLGADRGCVCATVQGGPPEISLRSAPRAPEAVDFQVFGEPARIARLLTAHGLRRRFGRRVAKVTGRRERLAALEALLDTPLDLMTLHRAGVRLDAVAVLKLASAMIEPAWTVRERFTLAHRDPGGRVAYLEVSDGRAMTVRRDAPSGRIATTIVGPDDDLLPVLCGHPGAATVVEGDLGPLTALRGWINRAQSG